MTPEVIVMSTAGFVVGVAIVFLIIKKRPKKLKQDKFTEEWKELQKLCKDKDTWPDAIAQADVLLDKALKKRKYKGGSMGERMVSAQKTFTKNDDVWFAHNLYKKITNDPELKLKADTVKTALAGFRQALRDLGALEKPPSQRSDEDEEKK